MPRWLEHLASIGIVTANPEIARRQRITNIGAFVAAGTTLGHLVINAVHDAGGLIAVHIFNTVFASLALLIPTLHRYGENAAAIGLATLVMLGTVVIVWLLGTASHLQIYFTLIGALLLFVGMQNWKLFSAYFVLFTMALLLTLNYAPHDGLIMPQDKWLRDMLTNQAMVNTITVNSVIIFYAVAALRRYAATAPAFTRSIVHTIRRTPLFRLKTTHSLWPNARRVKTLLRHLRSCRTSCSLVVVW